MFRRTYATIDGNQLEENVKEIKKKYCQYDYYIGVVKNNCYHHGMKCINELIKGGINYLAVSSLEEAMQVRKYNDEIPVLCLEPIDLTYIFDAINLNVTITVESLDYLKQLLEIELSYDLKIHLKIDSGMHRLGFNVKEEVNKSVKLINDSKHLILEGIYSHFATSGVTDSYYDEQVKNFKMLTKDIDLTKIPIVHLGRSLTLVQHQKLSFCNGIRLGIILFGFNQSYSVDLSFKGKLRELNRTRIQKKLKLSPTVITNDLVVKPVMGLYTTIISKRKILAKELVGYGTKNIIKEDGYIYTLAIGYADGVTKDFKSVIIDKEECPIVADCMDMIMVYSKEKYEVGTLVEIFGKQKSIKKVLGKMNLNAYHLFNNISNRVPRVHIYDGEEVEITY